MSVYSGFPNIILEGDKAAAQRLIPAGKALLGTAQKCKRKMGVSHFNMHRAVDKISTITVKTAGDVDLIIIAVNPQGPPQLIPEEYPPTMGELPDIYSGLVFTGTLVDTTVYDNRGEPHEVKALDSFFPTPSCVNRHPKMSTGKHIDTRLAEEPWVAMPELRNPGQDGKLWSQYVKLKPCMYSGLMAKVVQTVMGLGRIEISKFFNAELIAQDKDLQDYVREVRANGVRVQFDYRWHRTHGIHRAADGRLWLIEISANRGVVARLLPIFTDSNTPYFRDRVDSIEDSALGTVLDELGCLPTGEAFPGNVKEYNNLKTTGHILQLIEPGDPQLTEFFQLTGFSSANGWAFSPDGKEAHNTGYKFVEEDFEIQHSYWYCLNIDIGALKEHREPNEPIATGHASLKVMESSRLWSIGKIGRFIQFKQHEPLADGGWGALISHDALPGIPGRMIQGVACCAPLWVGYINGSLRVVRYLRQPVMGTMTGLETDLEEGDCMVARSWFTKQTSGVDTFPPCVFSNDPGCDPMEVVSENVVLSNCTSTDKGYDPPKFSDFIEAPEFCMLWREKAFEVTGTTDRANGEMWGCGVTIPGYTRGAYYFARGHWYSTDHSIYTFSYWNTVRDPHVYYGHRKFPRISWPPLSANCLKNIYLCGTQNTDRKIICHEYEPSNCSDFADTGPWAELCEQIEPMCTGHAPFRPSTGVTTPLGHDEKAWLTLHSDGGLDPKELPITYNDYVNWVEVPSPDEFGWYQHVYCQNNVLGAESAFYMTNLAERGGESVYIGYAPTQVDKGDSITFIGAMQPGT